MAEIADGLGMTEPVQRRATEQLLPTFEPTPIELVRSMRLQERVDRAIALLRKYEPQEGYYLADSYGKDSSACLRLAQLANVKFEAVHSFTTIDPPELLRFGKEWHRHTYVLRPETHMMTAVKLANKLPPTRLARWCCELYKENGGNDRVCIFGVRAAESSRRKGMWREVRDDHDKKKLVVCPIVYWTDDQVWEFLNDDNIPRCELYKEGFTRLGCVDCPLARTCRRNVERERWPRIAANWKRAIIANWQRMRTMLRRDGKPYMHSKFRTGEELYEWWLDEDRQDFNREECQTGLLWTNQELDEDA